MRYAFNTERFATRLMRWRQNRHASLRDTAERVGFSAATLSRLERGGVPDLRVFLTLCMAMNADPRDFVYACGYIAWEAV